MLFSFWAGLANASFNATVPTLIHLFILNKKSSSHLPNRSIAFPCNMQSLHLILSMLYICWLAINIYKPPTTICWLTCFCLHHFSFFHKNFYYIVRLPSAFPFAFLASDGQAIKQTNVAHIAGWLLFGHRI